MVRVTDALEPSPRIAFREIAGQVVIVNPLEDVMMTLNETASVVWSLLDGRDIADIGAVISQEFEVDEDAAVEDIMAFLDDLMGKGLVRLVNDSTEKKT